MAGTSTVEQFLLSQLHKAEEFNAHQIRFYPEPNKLTVYFDFRDLHNPDRMSTEEESHEVENEFVDELYANLISRSQKWKDSYYAEFTVADKLQKQILIAPPFGTRMIANISLQPKMGPINGWLLLSQISWDDVDSLLDKLELALSVKNSLKLLSRQKSGLVLGNHAEQAERRSSELDGFTALLAIRPDAVSVPEIKNEEDFLKILKEAEDQIVILGTEGRDALELIENCTHHFSDNQGLIRQFYKRLVFSFVHSETGRLCPHCIGETIPDKIIDQIIRLPEVLRPNHDAKLFSARGCMNCSHSGINGTIGINSALPIDSEMRDLFLHQKPKRQIQKRGIELGLHSTLEDGVKKVNLGLTSLKEILKVSTKIAPIAFLDATEGWEGIKDPIYLGDNLLEKPNLEIAHGTSEIRHAVNNPEKSSNRKILLVEDDNNVRAMLRMLLQKDSYDVLEAVDGEDGLLKLTAELPDLVISDLAMPNLDGREFVKRVREEDHLAQLPIMVLTAFGTEEKEIDLINLGADDFVNKTASPEKVLARVKRLLKHQPNQNAI